MTTIKLRKRMTSDRLEMKRRRVRYLRRCRFWLEADKKRIYDFAEHMKELGLYAPTTYEGDIRCGIIITLWKLDGGHGNKFNHDSGWALWLMKSGWSAYYGWENSKRRALKRLA